MKTGVQSKAGIFKKPRADNYSTASKQNCLKWYYKKIIEKLQNWGYASFGWWKEISPKVPHDQMLAILHIKSFIIYMMKPWQTHHFYWHFRRYIYVTTFDKNFKRPLNVHLRLANSDSPFFETGLTEEAAYKNNFF